MSPKRSLSDSSFLVLALLAEGERHGYEIQRLAHDRGFRFWTQLKRSSVYAALGLLEEQGLVSARVEAGEGPEKKTFRITKRGSAKLAAEGLRHLAAPAHPRSEIDLGIYALPFLPKVDAERALSECRAHLHARAAFLEERLSWCRARNLRVPALAFERPLLALRAEIEWLKHVATDYAKGGPPPQSEWASYVYREPPRADTEDAS